MCGDLFVELPNQLGWQSTVIHDTAQVFNMYQQIVMLMTQNASALIFAASKLQNSRAENFPEYDKTLNHLGTFLWPQFLLKLSWWKLWGSSNHESCLKATNRPVGCYLPSFSGFPCPCKLAMEPSSVERKDWEFSTIISLPNSSSYLDLEGIRCLLTGKESMYHHWRTCKA